MTGRPESVTQRRAGACASNRASSSAQNSTQSGEMRGLREIPKRADRRLCAPLSEGCFVEGDAHIRSFGVLVAWNGRPVRSVGPALPLMWVPAHGALFVDRASMVGMTTVRVHPLGRRGRAARPKGPTLQDLHA